MKIFLTGFMGSGKSSYGKRLARTMGFNFIDLDEYIESQENLKISEIFNKYGEEYFRKIEQKHLRSLLRKDDIVISTGGGTACYFTNMDEINSGGISIYLEMSNKALLNRLESSKKKRPKISNMNPEEMYEFIEKTMIEREPFYNKAKIKVNALGLDVKELLNLIKVYK